MKAQELHQLLELHDYLAQWALKNPTLRIKNLELEVYDGDSTKVSGHIVQDYAGGDFTITI